MRAAAAIIGLVAVRAFIGSMLLWVAACGAEDGRLLVDLRTDLDPGVDFTDIETRVGTRAPTLIPVNTSASFEVGSRIAEATGLDTGTHAVVVTLYTDRGSVLATRRTVVTVDGTTALLVTITRGCIGLDGCTWSGADAGVPLDASTPVDAGPTRDGGPTDAGVPVDAPPPDASADGGPCSPVACPCPVHSRGDAAYMSCSTPRVWDVARATCLGAGFDLVIIDDEIENEHVRTLVADDAWIGLSDLATEGTYLWVDGTPPAYTRWRAPDAPRGGTAYNCVELDPATGDWLDVACGSARPYVCERP